MEHLAKTKILRISAAFSAAEWGVYNSVDVRAVIAYTLNRQLEEYVNRGETREVTTHFMHSLMKHNSDFGVDDTFTREFLETVLDEIYL